MLVGDAESWGGWSRGRDIQKHCVPSAQTGHIPIIAFNNKVYFKSLCVCVPEHCMCTCVCGTAQVLVEARGVGSLEASCELPAGGAGN